MGKNNINIEGIGFIKSRKSETTIDKIAELMYAKAKEYEIERPKILIDDGCYTDIDRPAIDTLFKYLHYEFIKYLFIRRIMDISLEVEDLKKFIKDVNELNVIIICLGEETAMFSGEQEHVNCSGQVKLLHLGRTYFCLCLASNGVSPPLYECGLTWLYHKNT